MSPFAVSRAGVGGGAPVSGTITVATSAFVAPDMTEMAPNGESNSGTYTSPFSGSKIGKPGLRPTCTVATTVLVVPDITETVPLLQGHTLLSRLGT
jgi:hypothetical protein